MTFDVYRLYSKKSIRKNHVFKYACIISVILAVAIMLFMQITLDCYKNTLSDRIRVMNGSDVKILDKGYLEHQFSEEQLKFIKKTIGEKKYTLAYGDNSNIIAKGKDDMVAMTVFNRPDFISKFGIKSLDEGQVVISSSVAERLNIDIGDEIYIKLHSDNYADTKFQVAQILNDNVYFSVAGAEYEIAQEMLGYVYLVLPNFDKFNTAYIEGIEDETIDILEEKLSSIFDIRTIEELTDIVVPKVQLQMLVFTLISNIAMLISGVCLVWSFLIFILDRKNDFLIFKKIGMRTIDLLKLLLLEIYSMVIKGIICGIPLGILFSTIYLQKNGGIEGMTVFLVLKNAAAISLLVLIETAIFSFIPIAKMRKIVNHKDSDISIEIAVTVLNMIILSCIYVKSFKGVAFFIIIGTLFGIFYLILDGLTKIVLKMISWNKNKSFLFVAEMKNERKITSFSLNIINICMVIFLILLSVLPILYSPMEDGANIAKENIVYRTSYKNEKVENLLRKKRVKYEKFYVEKIEILQVNGIDVGEYMNENISDEYKEESVQIISKRNINIYEDTHASSILKSQDGIYINNMYMNMIDFKKGDILTILLNDRIIQCKVAGIYQDKNSQSTVVGAALESYMKSLKYDVRSSQIPIVYTFMDSISDDILRGILLEDKTAYIDKNQQLFNYLKQYIDKQKAVLVNVMIAVGFASVLLVFLGQMILFVKQKDYYTALWKIGMSKRYFISSLLIKKSILTMIQMIVIAIFVEPIRFLIHAEMERGQYSILKILLIEIIIIYSINLFSIICPFIIKKWVTKLDVKRKFLY